MLLTNTKFKNNYLCRFFISLITDLPCDPGIMLITRGNEINISKCCTYSNGYRSSFSVVSKWNELRCQPSDDLKENVLYACIRILPNNENEILTFTTK